MNGEESEEEQNEENDYFEITNNIPFVRKNVMSANFTISREAKEDDCNEIWFRWKARNKKPVRPFPLEVRQVAVENIFHEVRGIASDVVPGFTCLDHNNSILRAHPSYNSGREWYDHCLMIWSANDDDDSEKALVPAQIFMFLDLRNVTLLPGSAYENEIYCIVRSAKTNNRTMKPLRRARDKWIQLGRPSIAKVWTWERNKMWILPVKQIRKCAFVCHDYGDSNMTVKTEFLFEIMPKGIWHQGVSEGFGNDWYHGDNHRIMEEELSDVDEAEIIDDLGSTDESSEDESEPGSDESSIDDEFFFEDLDLGGVDL